ncbi:GNAT family N-acetyltransferase [Rhodococcus triatomae]|uniref:N-acetylglutamate synthase, GNAT family n=1 Tax=Rhodococcus triatomae TaxID=300028 RepID=A0A1G8J7I8_9NOCA|nr:GNAT family N-acetyltransferase [Rhodococcus triatomae]QNG19790.1 GNAT family N-acetyltransferase [Rhodococcus triatomae]QNG24294.1 GNAT family N-acetyltransferase [Rhodococcus triatomae]SDI27205.1 N-acetylglutamate synthase, GNAT family [Rhodococcus triatomae]
MIRSAVSSDLPVLQQIEIAAGAPFRDIGMSSIADDPPPTLDELEEFLASGRIFVVADERDHPVAYALVALVDGCAHVEQISVHPSHAHQGLGARLLDRISAWAGEHALPALTLTTFVEVPWNAPYYRRLGFRPVSDSEMTPGLSAIRNAEVRLDAWPRVTMTRPVTPAPHTASKTG